MNKDLEPTKFTKEDWEMFQDLIDNPQPPTERMKKAAEKYKSMTAEGLIKEDTLKEKFVNWIADCFENRYKLID